MATPEQAAPAAAERRETPRIQLARLAVSAALEQVGVTGADAARSRSTYAGREQLRGVTVMPDGGGSAHGSYAVALFLTAAPTDLPALAVDVETGVREAAAAAGLGDAISAVHITFTDLTLPEPERTAHA